MTTDERCPACPFHVLAEIFAAEVAAKLCPKEQPRVERLISPGEAARRIGKSRTWLDRRRHVLPFVKLRDSGRGYDIIEGKLSAWISTR